MNFHSNPRRKLVIVATIDGKRHRPTRVSLTRVESRKTRQEACRVGEHFFETRFPHVAQHHHRAETTPLFAEQSPPREPVGDSTMTEGDSAVTVVPERSRGLARPYPPRQHQLPRA
jgi:hypothetical protein